MVQQDVYLFSGTIAENIEYGRPGASREDVIAAGKTRRRALNSSPNWKTATIPTSANTACGFPAVRSRRISIARVFLKNPPC